MFITLNKKSRKKYICYHNSTKKKSTKFIPNEFRDLNDPNLIDNK